MRQLRASGGRPAESAALGRNRRGEKEGGIPWGEWDAATRDTAFRGVGRVPQCQNRMFGRGKSIRNFTRPSKQITGL